MKKIGWIICCCLFILAGCSKIQHKPAQSAVSSSSSLPAEQNSSAVASSVSSAQASSVSTKASSKIVSSSDAGQISSSKSTSGKNSAVTQKVSVSVKGNSKTGFILKQSDVAVKGGESVADVLKSALKQKNLRCEITSTGYVKGIDDLYQFDQGSQSGWVFRVNGVFPSKSCVQYTVKSGDVIEWLYTLNNGKDVGAVQP